MHCCYNIFLVSFGVLVWLGLLLHNRLHWTVKRKLGETDLPASFITYIGEEINIVDLSVTAINAITAVSFIAAAGISIYKNYKNYKPSKTKQ